MGSAKTSDLTCWEITGNVTPEPCEAVEMRPPIVWSEMDPMLRKATAGWALASDAWILCNVVPE